MFCRIRYFKLAKPADEHWLDPEGTLSSRLPSSAITSANLEVRFVIDSDHHPPFSNMYIYSLFGIVLPHAAFKRINYYRHRSLTCIRIYAINRIKKVAKLSSAKLISLLIRQTFVVYSIMI